MKITRRTFLQNASIAGSAMALTSLPVWAPEQSATPTDPGDRVDPWIEISEAAYLNNAREISRMASGKPILAVLKNNAYGLGAAEVGLILDKAPQVEGFAVVKAEKALEMRAAGVRKPILLMAEFAEQDGSDLVRNDITLGVSANQAGARLSSLSKALNRPAKVHLYLDSGLGRMGMPYHRALPWIQDLAHRDEVYIQGTFTTLTTPDDFAREQLERFKTLAQEARSMGIDLGKRHAAPSSSLLRLPASHLDMVRPGILLHGSFPSGTATEREMGDLRPTFRLRARVVRVEQLRAGDTIGFARFYTAEKPTWIGTIPIGWADGYASAAENGAQVLVGDRMYRVVNVNASHCNIELGAEPSVRIGEVATLIGPDHAAITPQGFADDIKGHTYLQINYKESIPKFVYPTLK